MACVPDRPCSSRRCAKQGVCNCFLEYDDGTTPVGSGRGSDPYVLERPPIRTIKNSDGIPLVANSRRCIWVPNHILGIRFNSTGQVFFPDAEGNVTIPCAEVSSFSVLDEGGNSYEITDNDILGLRGDGNTSPHLGTDYPRIITSNMFMPTLKASEATFDIFESSSVGSLHTLATLDIPYDPITQIKKVQYSLELQINDPQPFTAPLDNHYIEFDLNVANVSNVGGTPFITPLKQRMFWYGDYGYGQKSYYAQICLPVASQFKFSQVQLTITNESDLIGIIPGNLRYRGSLIASWI